MIAGHPGTSSALAGVRLRAAVQVFGLLALGGAVLRQIEWDAVAASWRGISTTGAVTIAVAVLASMSLRLWKWRVYVRATGLGHVPGAAVARGFLLGVLLGAVTPLRLGEFYRVAAAAGGDPEARGRAAAGVVLDRAYELVVVLTTLAIGAVLVDMSMSLCLGTAATAAAIGWIVLAGKRGLERPAAPATGPVARTLAALAEARRCLDGGDRVRVLAATAAAHALNLAAGLQIWRAFGELAAGDFVVRIPLVTLVNTLPITIGGFGARELAAIELFGSIGYPAGAAAAAAAGLFFAANVLPALALLPVVAVVRRWS